MNCGQLLHEHVLGPVGVLVLINQDIAKTALIMGQDLGEGGKQLDCDHEEVVEVHC